MPSLRLFEGLTLYDRKGAVGTVTHALCHPSEPVVVGIELQPPNLAYVVSRSPRYVALQGVTLEGDRLDVTDDIKDWTGLRAEKALGFEWEKTVIWVGMPLLTESGSRLGFIADASFDVPDARLQQVLITEGITTDVAVGTRSVDGTLLIGFDGEAVRVKDDASGSELSGGLAARAGSNVAVAKVVAGEAGKTAAALGGKALKAAAASKTAKRTWSMFRETGKAFREGMKDDEE